MPRRTEVRADPRCEAAFLRLRKKGKGLPLVTVTKIARPRCCGSEAVHAGGPKRFWWVASVPEFGLEAGLGRKPWLRLRE